MGGFISRDEIINQWTLLGLEQQPVMRALDTTGPHKEHWSIYIG